MQKNLFTDTKTFFLAAAFAALTACSSNVQASLSSKAATPSQIAKKALLQT